MAKRVFYALCHRSIILGVIILFPSSKYIFNFLACLNFNDFVDIQVVLINIFHEVNLHELHSWNPIPNHCPHGRILYATSRNIPPHQRFSIHMALEYTPNILSCGMEYSFFNPFHSLGQAHLLIVHLLMLFTRKNPSWPMAAMIMMTTSQPPSTSWLHILI
jgi:hypothetical protein